MKITRLIPVLLVSAPMASHAGGLGIQTNTSFVYGNATVGEVHGGLFVAGNLTDTTSNQLGNEFVNNSNHNLDVMRVGGALNWASGQSVKDGNVKVTGSENLTSQQIDNGYVLTQNYNFGNYFSSEQSNLLALSAAYAGLSSSGLTSNGARLTLVPSEPACLPTTSTPLLGRTSSISRRRLDPRSS